MNDHSDKLLIYLIMFMKDIPEEKTDFAIECMKKCYELDIFTHEETVWDFSNKLTIVDILNPAKFDDCIKPSYEEIVIFLVEFMTYLKKHSSEYKIRFDLTSQEWVSLTGLAAQLSEINNGEFKETLTDFFRILSIEKNS